MESKATIFHVRILIDVVDASGVEQRSTSLDAMDFVAFF
jgi:hypothetical protein